ncbi:hypothetical protein HYW36_00660 [Candidatus Saccharibacteria bacterium]|nr:hypothetical protein [Candidatus Saccharibacteria bacterium]
MQYDIYNGVKHQQIKFKKIVIAVVASAGMVAGMAVPALAAGPGYSPPPAVADACNAGHGAFAAFSDPSQHWTPGQPPYFGDGELGSARGGATGANNSSYSQYCQSL